MSDQTKDPYLVEYEVSYENSIGYTSTETVKAHLYKQDPELPGWLTFERYIPAGECQRVASFPLNSVYAVVGTPAHELIEVPDYVPSIPADDEVPF